MFVVRCFLSIPYNSHSLLHLTLFLLPSLFCFVLSIHNTFSIFVVQHLFFSVRSLTFPTPSSLFIFLLTLSTTNHIVLGPEETWFLDNLCARRPYLLKIFRDIQRASRTAVEKLFRKRQSRAASCPPTISAQQGIISGQISTSSFVNFPLGLSQPICQ